MRTTSDSHGISLGVSVGLASMALACVPKVSAQIVVSAADPESAPAEGEAEQQEGAGKRKRGVQLPPQILRAEHISDGHLRLHFSEPLATIDPGFDPNDFRLSVVNVYLYEEYEAHDGSAYPNYGHGYAYEESYSHGSYVDFGYSYYGSRMQFVRWQHDGAELNLYFTPEISPYACRQITRYTSYGRPNVTYENGLFLHYASGPIPLRDEQGYPVANIGADWVIGGRADPPLDTRELEDAELEHAGDGLLEVSCEAVLPPGPR